MQFTYAFSDLHEKFTDKQNISNNFDSIFLRRWDELHSTAGLFRYQLGQLEEKTLPGKYGFVLQLNPERATMRRKPEQMFSIKQDFDPDKFNFNKIQQNELMFELKRADSEVADSDGTDSLIINSSPITRGHSLLCPQVDRCLPQIITLESLVLAAYLMFLSANRDLRIGFNGLCAMASVNHLHYHLLFVDKRLPIENVVCEHLSGPLFCIDTNYPAKCFCFEIKTKHNIESACGDIFKLVSYLTDNNIAHNLYMSVGEGLENSGITVVRVFVWARTNCYGAKEITGFNLAICELSGHFPVKTLEDYESLTESEIIGILEENTSPVFDKIKHDITALFTQ